jgi:hypothetical protein
MGLKFEAQRSELRALQADEQVSHQRRTGVPGFTQQVALPAFHATQSAPNSLGDQCGGQQALQIAAEWAVRLLDENLDVGIRIAPRQPYRSPEKRKDQGCIVFW